MRKFLIAGLSLFFGILACLGVAGVVSYIRFTPSAQEAIAQPWIPAWAEVDSKEVVHPGTFTTDITLQDLQETTKPGQRIKVVYDTYHHHRTSPTNGSIEYYRPTGDGDFDYLKILVSPPRKDLPFPDSLFTKWETSFDKQNRVFQFTLVKDPSPSNWSFVLAVVGVAGGVYCIGFIWAALRTRRRIIPVPTSE